jgi:hypothetical protein
MRTGVSNKVVSDSFVEIKMLRRCNGGFNCILFGIGFNIISNSLDNETDIRFNLTPEFGWGGVGITCETCDFYGARHPRRRRVQSRVQEVSSKFTFE